MIDLNKHVMKVELIDYFDVWGDPINGWEVNNQCSEWCGYIMRFVGKTIHAQSYGEVEI